MVVQLCETKYMNITYVSESLKLWFCSHFGPNISLILNYFFDYLGLISLFDGERGQRFVDFVLKKNPALSFIYLFYNFYLNFIFLIFIISFILLTFFVLLFIILSGDSLGCLFKVFLFLEDSLYHYEFPHQYRFCYIPQIL